MNILWSQFAVKDLVRLRKFIDKNNPIAAKRIAKVIKDSVLKLSDNPMVGRPVEDLIDYRDLVISAGAHGYVVRYRIHENKIYIINIRHQKEISN